MMFFYTLYNVIVCAIYLATGSWPSLSTITKRFPWGGIAIAPTFFSSGTLEISGGALILPLTICLAAAMSSFFLSSVG